MTRKQKTGTRFLSPSRRTAQVLKPLRGRASNSQKAETTSGLHVP